MSYSINQFCGTNKNYMSLLTIPTQSYTCKRFDGNDCLYYSPSFDSTKTYFLHCWVIDNTFLQKVKIKLCKIVGNELDTVKQNVRYFEYPVASQKQWKEILLIFKPVNDDFNGVIFERQDAGVNQYTTIIFEELSEVGNVILRDLSDITIFKLGIRGSANSVFSINNEYINIGKSGLIEFKEEDTRISQICPVIPAKEDTSILDSTKSTLITEDDSTCISTCLFNYAKTRDGVDFILDYIYKVME